MKKAIVTGMLVLGLVAVGCNDDADPTEAPAAVETQSVDDAVDTAEQDAEAKADDLEQNADELEDDLEEKADEVEASLRADE